MFVAFAIFALVATVAADKPEFSPGYNPAANLVLLPLKSAAYSAPPSGYQPPFVPVSFAAPANVKSAEVETISPTTEKSAKASSTAAPAAAEEAQFGRYFILSPEGKLQKVEYVTAAQPQSETAQKAAQYNAQPPQPAQFKGSVSSFQYKDVEPVSAPIYSYSNVPGPLVRILRRAERF